MKFIKKKYCIYENELENIDNFIEDNCGLIFHETEFNKIVTKSFNTEFSYLIVYDNKKRIIAICPVHTTKKGILKSSNRIYIEIPFAGWVYDSSKLNFLELNNLLKIPYNEALSIVTNPYENSIAREIINLPVYKKKYSLKIDFEEYDDIEKIFAESISKNTRHNIRRASRKGVSIEELKEDKLNIFYSLVENLKKERKLKSSGIKFYEDLLKYYYSKRQIKILAAKFDNEYISTLCIIGNGNVMHAWIAGRISNLPKNLYQNELLWWESIKWAKNQGTKIFDLCVVDLEQLSNIAKFKMGFSKQKVPFYVFPKRSLLYRIINRIQG